MQNLFNFVITNVGTKRAESILRYCGELYTGARGDREAAGIIRQHVGSHHSRQTSGETSDRTLRVIEETTIGTCVRYEKRCAARFVIQEAGQEVSSNTECTNSRRHQHL